MDNGYEVKVTRQALDQMRAIIHYSINKRRQIIGAFIAVYTK